MGVLFISEARAVNRWSTDDKPKIHPLGGPLVAREFFLQLQATSMSLPAYDSNWRHRSGVPESGVVAKMHTALCEVLRWMITVDQLDGVKVVSCEAAVRELLRVEAAVNRNPKQPDWEGLEIMVSGTVNARGGVETPAFSQWVSTNQASRAQMLKQDRLLREERVQEGKRRGNDKGGKKEGEGGYRCLPPLHFYHGRLSRCSRGRPYSCTM